MGRQLEEGLQLFLIRRDGAGFPELGVKRFPNFLNFPILHKPKNHHPHDNTDNAREKPLEEDSQKRVDVKNVREQAEKKISDKTHRHGPKKTVHKCSPQE